MDVTTEVQPEAKRDFRVNDAGKLVEVVLEEKEREIAEFKVEVETNQNDFNEATGALEEAERELEEQTKRVEELKAEKRAAGVALEDSKSVYVRVAGLVGESTDWLDNGASATSIPVAVASQEF